MKCLFFLVCLFIFVMLSPWIVLFFMGAFIAYEGILKPKVLEWIDRLNHFLFVGPEPEVKLIKEKTEVSRCPYCHDDVSLGEDIIGKCRRCLAIHHYECWEEADNSCSCCLEKEVKKIFAFSLDKQPEQG